MEHIETVVRKWVRNFRERDQLILTLWLNGHTKAAIGRKVGLSRQRVWVILEKMLREKGTKE